MAGPSWKGIATNAVADKATRDNFRAINLYLRSVSKGLAGGTAEAPADGLPGEAYVTIGNTGGLSQERALAVAAPITFSDGGAGGSVTIGASMVVPAFVLGTTAAAGSATSLVRSDATIAAFDTTAPANSDAGAAVVGVIAKSARRDHKHLITTASPSGGHAASASIGTATSLLRSDAIFEFATALQSAANSFKITATDNGTILTLASPRDTTFDIGSGGILDSLTFDLTDSIVAGQVFFRGAGSSLISWLMTSISTSISMNQTTAIIQATGDPGDLKLAINNDGNIILQSSPATDPNTVANVVQLSTGDVAGAHFNFNDKLGIDPSPSAGDLTRNGDALNYETSAGGTTNLIPTVISKTGAYTIVDSDRVVVCDASGGAFTITLPAASGRTGRIYHIKKTDSSGNAVTIDGNASETIDGSTTVAISTQFDSLMIISDGSNWHII